MQKFAYLLFIFTFFQAQYGFSQLLRGDSLTEVGLSELVQKLEPGQILLLGENHGNAAHRDQHIEVLEALKSAGFKVSVGMEFINYTDQTKLDFYRQGLIDEAAFLKEIKWGGFSFDYYREQILFPEISRGETTIGLNIPRAVTSKISRQGLDSLTPEERALMPPNFALGRDSYRERFMQAAGHHCKNPQNCFIAQCAWDDTMAWQAVQFIEKNPDHVLVIVVGEFHVQYGGGLKHRILQRAPRLQVHTLSQVWAEGLSDEELQNELKHSPSEGPRADFIWVSRP